MGHGSGSIVQLMQARKGTIGHDHYRTGMGQPLGKGRCERQRRRYRSHVIRTQIIIHGIIKGLQQIGGQDRVIETRWQRRTELCFEQIIVHGPLPQLLLMIMGDLSLGSSASTRRQEQNT